MIRKLYPYGKQKAFNITYDDGVLQDVRFVRLLNRYGIKGTFNLNSELMQTEFAWTHENGMEVKRLSMQAVANLYDGHEVASHTLTHPYMHDLSENEILHQMGADRYHLEQLFGVPIKGFAVPFTFYSDLIARCAEKMGFSYARMSEFSHSYVPCKDYFYWKTGIFHLSPDLVPFVEGFLQTDEELAVCQIAGHSYDLDAENLWETMEDILRRIQASDDVWTATNLEIVEYLKAMEHAEISKGKIANPTSLPLWFEVDGKRIEVQPYSICEI